MTQTPGIERYKTFENKTMRKKIDSAEISESIRHTPLIINNRNGQKAFQIKNQTVRS